jgi:hypothetical protein
MITSRSVGIILHLNVKAIVNEFEKGETALLSHERSECKPDRAQQSRKAGSAIAKRIPRGVVPEPKQCGFGTTPALRATPPNLGGEFRFPNVHSHGQNSNSIPTEGSIGNME